jgi:hypothetical protein
VSDTFDSLDEQSSLIKPHGGKRPGAGRKRGTRTRKTIEIQEAAKKYAGDMIKALVDVALNSESDSARVAAANALLDRGYGKPRQAVELSGAVAHAGVLIVPNAPDADAWAQQVRERQAALAALSPASESDEAA